MALGGGTWLTQNKVLPGTYVVFSSVAKASATLSDRGYAAAPFKLSWGPENEVFAVTSGEFQKNSKAIFGYAYDHPKMLALREIFLHATTVYCYRLGSGANKATNTFAEAKYPGVRGNDITIKIAANVDNGDLWDVSTYLDGTCIETQTVADAKDLAANDYVVFKNSAQLSTTAGVALTGGTDTTNITGDHHQAFLDKIEAYSFNALCCPASDATTVKLYAAYTERVRDEVGAKFQLIAWQPSTVDYEGVIGVWNTASHATISGVDENALVYWATGAHASRRQTAQSGSIPRSSRGTHTSSASASTQPARAPISSEETNGISQATIATRGSRAAVSELAMPRMAPAGPSRSDTIRGTRPPNARSSR